MRKLVLFFFLIWMNAACTSSAELSSPTLDSISTPSVTLTKQASSNPTETPEPIPTATVQEMATVPPTSPVVPQPQSQVCSPLSIHPLQELPEIIGDPYDPPRPGREERHHGIDFAYYHYKDRDSMLEEPVQTILPGIVASVIEGLYPYGNMVMIEVARKDLPTDLVARIEIEKDESLYVLYAHLNQAPLVKLGDQVEACQPIGEVGMSGNTDIPHLHLETRVGPAGQMFESMSFYDTRASQEEMDNYMLWRTSDIFRHFDPMKLFGYDLEELEEAQAP
jgi:murein DD-endopeptidase MepM/ murein hydrolase activator NlpD